jgi:hypothetical protein
MNEKFNDSEKVTLNVDKVIGGHTENGRTISGESKTIPGLTWIIPGSGSLQSLPLERGG